MRRLTKLLVVALVLVATLTYSFGIFASAANQPPLNGDAPDVYCLAPRLDRFIVNADSLNNEIAYPYTDIYGGNGYSTYESISFPVYYTNTAGNTATTNAVVQFGAMTPSANHYIGTGTYIAPTLSTPIHFAWESSDDFAIAPSDLSDWWTSFQIFCSDPEAYVVFANCTIEGLYPIREDDGGIGLQAFTDSSITLQTSVPTGEWRTVLPVTLESIQNRLFVPALPNLRDLLNSGIGFAPFVCTYMRVEVMVTPLSAPSNTVQYQMRYVEQDHMMNFGQIFQLYANATIGQDTFNPVRWIDTMIADFFAIKLYRNITFGTITLCFLGVCACVAILKLFAGG